MISLCLCFCIWLSSNPVVDGCRMGRLVVTKKPRMLESAVRRIGIVPLEMDILTDNYKNKIGVCKRCHSCYVFFCIILVY